MIKFVFSTLLIIGLIFPSSSFASHVNINSCIELSHCVLEEWNVDNVENPYEKIKAIIKNTPRMEIVESDGDYIHAVATSRIMKYKDDLEVSYLSDSNTLLIRSESRVGEGDFGVNQKRVDVLKSQLLEP